VTICPKVVYSKAKQQLYSLLLDINKNAVYAAFTLINAVSINVL
jgi:hypothetical protein